MFKIFISTFVIALIFTATVAYPQATQSPDNSQCAQYQSQCTSGQQGAQQGQAVFPTSQPMPTSSNFNQTAAEQLPYCQSMAQACESQQTQATQAPGGGAAGGGTF